MSSVVVRVDLTTRASTDAFCRNIETEMAINSEYAVKILETLSEWGEEFGKVVFVSKNGLR